MGKLAALLLAAAIVPLAACAGSDDAPETEPAPKAVQTPAPETEAAAPEPEMTRLGGITTAGDFTEFGDEGPGRWDRAAPRAEGVRISSSADGVDQPALWLPAEGEGSPLLVVLHSWSTPYTQHLGIPFARWAEEHGWAATFLDFRGVSFRPEATGSDLVVQDVIDEERVFAIGFSGGGMVSLLAASRHPERFAGAVAWVPVFDLEDWYRFRRRASSQETRSRTSRATRPTFTTQPTPSGRGVKIVGSSGFQKAARRRAGVGKRRS